MPIEHVEILVEEPSAEAALEEILPKIFGNSITFSIHSYQCKNDLIKKLPDRLRGYKFFLSETHRILILVDRDGDDCKELKSKLEEIADKSGLISKTRSRNNHYQIVNRIVIEELEAWFFGDMQAVRSAYPGVAKIENKAKYRDPDAISGGTWEALERILKQAGYFSGGLRKIEAARSIAKHIDPSRNRSRSFKIFRDTLLSMLE
jgi:hypothetical protein